MWVQGTFLLMDLCLFLKTDPVLSCKRPDLKLRKSKVSEGPVIVSSSERGTFFLDREKVGLQEDQRNDVKERWIQRDRDALVCD